MTLIPQPLVFSLTPQSPQPVVTTGLTTAVNGISSVAGAQVLAADSRRSKIMIHNPGAVDVLVYQAKDINNAALAPTFAAPGGGFVVFANGGSLTLEGVVICQTAFGAIAKSATGALTILTQPTGT
jgi:hypothetical protein